jgi:ABC-2 type transport system permease protein
VKGAILVCRRDLNEMRATAAFRIIVAFTIIITAIAAVAISIALHLQSWYGAPEAAPILDLILGLIAYFFPLFILITFIWAFASFPITSEKVNGNIECLLATPLSPKELWVGKGLAIFLPGYLISLIASCIVLLTVNFAAVLPGWEIFILPGAALVNGLVINPLLLFGILSFIILFSLADNPDVAIAPSFLIGFGLMIGIPVGLMTGTIDISSWSFVLWYLGGVVVVWAVVLYLRRLLTRQNIVLSSKGS